MSSVYLAGPESPTKAILNQAFLSLGCPFAQSADMADAVILIPSSSSAPCPVLTEVDRLKRSTTSYRTVVLLSSAQVYGEGEYMCGDCGPISGPKRSEAQMGRWRWEVYCPFCGEMLMPLALTESSPLYPTSAYGQYLVQLEQALDSVSAEKPYPVIRLRLFLPYWPNPLFLQENTAVALFTQTLLNQKTIEVYEDGNQLRDITHGEDINQILYRILTTDNLQSGAYNIGSGGTINMFEVAGYLQEGFGQMQSPYQITESYRSGDIRHRFADIRLARKVLGYTPRFSAPQGLLDYAKRLSQTSYRAEAPVPS